MNKKLFFIIVVLYSSFSLIAQIENNDSFIKFDIVEDDFKAPDELLLPAIKAPSLTPSRKPYAPLDFTGLGLEKTETLDITYEDDFLDLKTDTAPKYFSKDKEAKKEFGRDQDLGSITTNSSNVTIMYRDHEYVDGDRVRIYVNGDIVKSNAYLSGGFNGFTFPLQDGFNRIEFQALNQGTSGPNTAELRVFDEEGLIISSNQWNLLTGRKATIIVVKN